MTATFKQGDKVLYGVIPGVVLGVFQHADNIRHALVFTEYEKESLRTAKEVMATGDRLGDVFFLFIRDYFTVYNLNEEKKALLKQKRFATVALQDLHRASYSYNSNTTSNEPSPMGSLIKRRHLCFVMLKKYMKEEGDEKITRMYERIDSIQAEIDLQEQQELIERELALGWFCGYPNLM